AMAAVVVHGTRTVPTQAAVKATYVMLVGSAFAFFFAAGFVALGARTRRVLTTVCGALAVASIVVFAHGRFLPNDWSAEGLENSIVQNMYGVLYHAAGDDAVAEEKFRAAAARGFHLGYENLASLAFESGKLDEAKYFLHTAALREPGQAKGTRAQREQAIRATQAEYLNSLAVIEASGGDFASAREALERSRRYDPSIPESAYNAGVIDLLEARSATA